MTIFAPLRRSDLPICQAVAAPRIPLPLPGGNRVLEGDPDRSQRFGTGRMRVGLSYGGQTATLRCPAEVLTEQLRDLAPDLDLGEAAPGLAALLLEAALVPVLAPVEAEIGWEIRVTDVRADTGEIPSEGLQLVLADGKRRWPLHVAPEPLDCPGFLGLLARWPTAPRLMERLPIPLILRLGTVPLRLADLRLLRLDDTLLMKTRRDAGGMFVFAERWVAEADADADGWRLAGGLRLARTGEESTWTMQNEAEQGVSNQEQRANGQVERGSGEQGSGEQGAGEQGSGDREAGRAEPRAKGQAEQETGDEPERAIGDPDDLPVLLAFDVGRTEITLGELRRLGIGSTIELGRRPDSLVRVTTNGRLIGYGSLVEIEGTVGVRIKRLFDLE